MGAEFGVVLESEVVLQDGGYQAGKARVSGKGGVVEMVGQDFADEVGVHVHGAWTVWWGVSAPACFSAPPRTTPGRIFSIGECIASVTSHHSSGRTLLTPSFFFNRKTRFRLCGPVDWRISFPANLNSPSDASSLTRGLVEMDNLPPGRERILRLRLAFIYIGSLSESRKIYASPEPEGLKQRESNSLKLWKMH